MKSSPKASSNIFFNALMKIPSILTFLLKSKHTPVIFLEYVFANKAPYLFASGGDMYADLLLSNRRISFRSFNQEFHNQVAKYNFAWIAAASSNPLLTNESMTMAVNYASLFQSNSQKQAIISQLMDNPKVNLEQMYTYASILPEYFGSRENTPREVLDEIMKVTDPEESWAAALNPNSSIGLAAKTMLGVFNAYSFFNMDEYESIEPRCDVYLRTLGYTDNVLESLPYRMKLELVSD